MVCRECFEKAWLFVVHHTNFMWSHTFYLASFPDLFSNSPGNETISTCALTSLSNKRKFVAMANTSLLSFTVIFRDWTSWEGNGMLISCYKGLTRDFLSDIIATLNSYTMLSALVSCPTVLKTPWRASVTNLRFSFGNNLFVRFPCLPTSLKSWGEFLESSTSSVIEFQVWNDSMRKNFKRWYD